MVVVEVILIVTVEQEYCSTVYSSTWYCISVAAAVV